MRLFQAWLAAMLCLVLGLGAAGCDDGDGSPRDSGVDGSGVASPSASGVDRSKYMDELSSDEVQKLCSWSASITAPGEYTCAGGATMNARTTSECADAIWDTPKHCLVSLTEDCVVSTKDDPCQMLVTAPCIAFVKCVSGN